MVKKLKDVMNELQEVSLRELSEFAYANYREREQDAKEKVRKAFNLAAEKQSEVVKEKLVDIFNKVIQAIEHVGYANYTERESEARAMINEAFSN